MTLRGCWGPITKGSGGGGGPDVRYWLNPTYDYKHGLYTVGAVTGATLAVNAMNDGLNSTFISGVPVFSYSGSPAGNMIYLNERVQQAFGPCGGLWFGITCISDAPGQQIQFAAGTQSGIIGFTPVYATPPVGHIEEVFAGPMSTVGISDIDELSGGDENTFGYMNWGISWSGADQVHIMGWRLGVI